jgi:hypothetical protein
MTAHIWPPTGQHRERLCSSRSSHGSSLPVDISFSRNFIKGDTQEVALTAILESMSLKRTWEQGPYICLGICDPGTLHTEQEIELAFEELC